MVNDVAALDTSVEEPLSGPTAIVFYREETPQALDTSGRRLELAKSPGMVRHIRQDLIRQLRFSSNPLKTALFMPAPCTEFENEGGPSTDEHSAAMWDISADVDTLFDKTGAFPVEVFRMPRVETLLAGIHCLDAVEDKNVNRVMRQFRDEEEASQGSSCASGCGARTLKRGTLEALREELSCLHHDAPGCANLCIDSLTQSPLGRAIIRCLYFGDWAPGKDKSKSVFDMSDYRGLLDVRAFISTAHGRVLLNGFYLILFWVCIVALFCFGRPLGEFSPTYDIPILCFWMGTVIDEAGEFYKQPRYLQSIWNKMDCGIFAALASYFAFKGVEPVCRMMVSITAVMLMLRMLGSFRNAEHWPVKDLGLLIQTAMQMVRSIQSFLILYFYILLSFAVGFLFLFYGTDAEEDGAQRQLRMHRVRDGWRKNGPFTSMQSTALWLFDASLGEFNFEEVSMDLYGFLGTGMLIVFLILSPIVLMNFLIAKLSSTYEAALENSRRVHLFGLAQDALQKPYIPDMREVPWMPPPVNLANLALLWIYQLLKVCLAAAAWVLQKCCRSNLQDRQEVWRCILRGCHFRAQLLLVVTFGNVLMICCFSIANGTVKVLFMIVVVVLSPFLTIFCLAIVSVGHLHKEWKRFTRMRDPAFRRRLSRRRTGRAGTSSASPKKTRGVQPLGEGPTLQPEGAPSRRIGGPFHSSLLHCLAGNRIWSFYEGLHWRKQMILCGPPVSLLEFVVYVFLGELKTVFECPVFRFFLPVLHWESLDMGIFQHDQDIIDILTVMAVAVAILVWCQLVWSVMCLLHWMYEVTGTAVMMRGGSREALLNGWGTMLRLARSTADDVCNESYQYMPVEATRDNVPIHDTQSSARDANKASTDGGSCNTPIGSSFGRPTSSVAKRLPMDITDFFITFFVSDPQEGNEQEMKKMKPLLVQAVQLIYTSDAFDTKFFENLAYFINIQDWYLIVCSIVWCLSDDRAELELIDDPDPEKRQVYTLEPGQVDRLRQHPLFGLYCFYDEEDNLTGVFFEDFFWAVWSGHFNTRYSKVETLLRGLHDLDAEQYVQEEEDQLSQFSSSLQVGGHGL